MNKEKEVLMDLSTKMLDLLIKMYRSGEIDETSFIKHATPKMLYMSKYMDAQYEELETKEAG